MTDRQPEGRRVLFDWDVHRRMYGHPEDKLTTEKGETFTAFWWDHGVADAVKAFDEFFIAYQAQGGKLDYFVIDSEHSVGSDVNTPERWQAAAKDPRFAAVLKDMGCASYTEFDKSDTPHAHAYWRYSTFLAWQHNQKIYDVVRKYYPQVIFSDYGACYNRLTDLVAWGHWRFDDLVLGQYGGHVGTHQAPCSMMSSPTWAGLRWTARSSGSGRSDR